MVKGGDIAYCVRCRQLRRFTNGESTWRPERTCPECGLVYEWPVSLRARERD